MNLIRRTLTAATITTACMLSTTAVQAATFTATIPTTQLMFAKAKTIQFSIRNGSGSAIEVRAGDQVMKIEAGKTISVSLPIGTRIVADNETSKHKSGELLAEVSEAMKDATLTIN